MAWAADIASIIPTFKFPGGLTVTRKAPGSRTDGIWVPGASSNFTLDPVAIHPSMGKDLLHLPEGLRAREAYTLYCTQALIASNVPNGAPPDLISYNGLTLEVQKTEEWASNGAFYVAIATVVPLT